MILFSAGLAAAAAAAARRRRHTRGEPDPSQLPDLSRLLWGEVVVLAWAARARLRRRALR